KDVLHLPSGPTMRTSLLLVFALLLSAPAALAGEPDLTGRWAGKWESDANGHNGPLRAKFRRINDTQYRVGFTGRFFRVVPFLYAVTLDVTGVQGDAVLLSGSSRLPLFGTFEYSAVATDTDFDATFRSGNDSGKFILRRECK